MLSGSAAPRRATVPCKHHASRHRDMRQRQPTCPACIPVTAPAFAGYARGYLVRTCPHIGSQPPNHPESLVVIPVRRSRATAFVLNFHKSIDKQHARQKMICTRRQPASLLVHSISPPALLPALQPPKTKDCELRSRPPAASLHSDQSRRRQTDPVTQLLSPHRESLTVHSFDCPKLPS
jgi:hypothetical protein